jgi:hypothetical protein
MVVFEARTAERIKRVSQLREVNRELSHLKQEAHTERTLHGDDSSLFISSAKRILSAELYDKIWDGVRAMRGSV